jgi:hypothetical protein
MTKVIEHLLSKALSSNTGTTKKKKKRTKLEVGMHAQRLSGTELA